MCVTGHYMCVFICVWMWVSVDAESTLWILFTCHKLVSGGQLNRSIYFVNCYKTTLYIRSEMLSFNHLNDDIRHFQPIDFNTNHFVCVFMCYRINKLRCWLYRKRINCKGNMFLLICIEMIVFNSTKTQIMFYEK